MKVKLLFLKLITLCKNFNNVEILKLYSTYNAENQISNCPNIEHYDNYLNLTGL